MNFLLEINYYLLIAFTVLNLSLALFVYFKKDREEITQSFSLVVLGASLWAFTNAMALRSIRSSVAILWSQVSYVSAIIIAGSFACFSLLFPKKETEDSSPVNKIKFYIFLSSLAVSVIAFIPNFTVIDVQVDPWHIDTGPGIYIFALFFIVVMGWSFKNLINSYRQVEGLKKLQLKYVFLGFFISTFFGGFFNLALPLLGNYDFVWLGPMFTIFLIGFIAYAIVKKDLFNIKVVLTAILVVLMTVLLIVDMVMFAESELAQILKLLSLLIFIFFGRYLIINVAKEVSRREELEKLSDKLVRTNLKLKEANEDLKKLDSAKSEFISIASHQLRTPLTSIKGYLSMINEGNYGNIPKPVEEKIENVIGSSERLINLVNDLLNVSRIESGKINLNFKEVKIDEFAEELAEQMRIVAQKKDLHLNLEMNMDSNLTVEIDEYRIRQVLVNLIDNAIKYTKSGGVTFRIQKKSINLAQSFLIEIKDTGEGLNSKDIENIFDSFSRGSAGDLMNNEGAGLGLYIAKKFIDMHNGEIWVESQGKGRGTSFFIELPLRRGD